MLALGAGLLACAAASCTHWFASGVRRPDDSRPVVLIETRGGVELGSATTEGVLFLGRTAQEGPCRVHYFLGDTPMVDDGAIRPVGGDYYLADVDLKQQRLHLLQRDLREQDELVAMLHGGLDVVRVPVRLARDERIEGDVLEWPGRPLPAGTPVLVEQGEEDYLFLGLVTGAATLSGDGGERRYLLFSGTDRLRQLLATPRRWPVGERVEYRPDDVHVIRRR